MIKVTQLPPFAKTVHVEADVPISQRDEFERAIVDIVAGQRPRMEALDRDLAAIKNRAMAGLAVIEKAINDHPTTGGAGRLVRFLAGVYADTLEDEDLDDDDYYPETYVRPQPKVGRNDPCPRRSGKKFKK